MYANFRRLYIIVVEGGRKFPWLRFNIQFLYTCSPACMEHGITGDKNGSFCYSTSFKSHYCFISSLTVKLHLDSFPSLLLWNLCFVHCDNLLSLEEKIL